MQKLVVATVASVLGLGMIGSSAFATSTEGFYLGLQAGSNKLKDTEAQQTTGEMDNGYKAAGVLGYDFGYFRAEAEVSYRTNDIDRISYRNLATEAGGDVSSTSFMLNGYLDFENSTPFTPYIGAGIGYNYVDFDGYLNYSNVSVKFDNTDNVLAYQLMAGISWNILESLALELSYNYYKSDNIDTSGTSNYGFTVEDEIDYESHSFIAGLRYYF